MQGMPACLFSLEYPGQSTVLRGRLVVERRDQRARNDLFRNLSADMNPYQRNKNSQCQNGVEEDVSMATAHEDCSAGEVPTHIARYISTFLPP